ncbi:MAG: ParB N-terminal domain-containing protein [Spirochaetaceae bacterium]|nr:ParB N-terminal domain-containing protein [Spirochaetaceae bacterium]
MLINIDEIKIKKRVRKDLGDLETLKDSLRRYGLLSPITINTRNELVAGQRRLESAKQLGWTTITANVVDAEDKIGQLEMELEENTQRLPFTDEELLAGYNALEKLKNPPLFTRIMNGIKNFFTCCNEKSEQIREEKISKSFKFALLLPIGIISVIVFSILYKTSVISGIVRAFIDVINVCLMGCGLIFTIRLFILKKSKNKSQIY